MEEKNTQEERLDYLVEEFKADSVQYKDLRTPTDTEEKRRILRSLMNIRMPKKMDETVLAVQDDYLKERIRENGIVGLADIPEVRDSLSIWQGDITRLAVDAIVNAANSQMLGCFVPMHTCIDNCIHTFAGIQLRQECNEKMNRLRIKYGHNYEQPTAVPMLTDAYNLPAKKVIHIVGPIVNYKLTPALEKDLEDCYRNTLDMCADNGLRSVAFCCISTGVFFLDVATGFNTPTIFKVPFWQMTAEWSDATYACLNYGQAFAPDEIKEKSICINGDIGEILSKL